LTNGQAALPEHAVPTTAEAEKVPILLR
jgi:hypothetical protein